MKKKVARMICILCTCCAIFVFAASAKTAYVVKNDSGTYTSSAVGLAAQATYVAIGYNTSSGTVMASCQRAIPGDPYTNLNSATIGRSERFDYTSSSGPMASYRLKLSGTGTAEGYVTC